MTPAIITALKNIAHAQIRLADGIASTQGRDVADQMVNAYQELIAALDEPPTSIFREPVFTPKKKAAKKK